MAKFGLYSIVSHCANGVCRLDVLTGGLPSLQLERTLSGKAPSLQRVFSLGDKVVQLLDVIPVDEYSAARSVLRKSQVAPMEMFNGFKHHDAPLITCPHFSPPHASGH